MAFKRPFGEEESFDLPSKHPRQLECCDEPTPFDDATDIVPYDDGPHKPQFIASEDERGFNKSECTERVASGSATDLIGGDKEFEPNAPGFVTSFSWITSSASVEDSKSEAADRLPYYPAYFESEHHTRSFHEEIYNLAFDFPPRRSVSIGTDHQADIPEWRPEGGKSNSDCIGSNDPDTAHPQSSGSNCRIDGDNREELMGTCVLPMPSSDNFTSDVNEVGNSRKDCFCQDMGSIRCVQQHIVEAREKLRETLGQERFRELGFYDMGEEVAARKWNEEDEQIFHEVVYSHPASLGKNFWDHLSDVFPSRTNMELVSYYFNVFVLRRRAEQNRVNSLNIDSDNDEWQGSEDGDELGSSEEDEDSVIQSPINPDESLCIEHFNEVDEEDGEECCDDNNLECGNVGFTKVERRENDIETVKSQQQDNCSSVARHEQNGEEDNDFQDDSCTSYEGQPSRSTSCCGHGVGVGAGQGRQGQQAESDQHYSRNGGVEEGLTHHEYGIEAWDFGGYIASAGAAKGEVDFVPTCHMIKEVFGEEGWNNKERGDGRASAGFS